MILTQIMRIRSYRNIKPRIQAFKQKARKWCIVGIACWMSACSVDIPSDVIQPEEMEQLLYDYHLMQAFSSELSSTDKYKRELYEKYIFQKHGVTEEEFDSSLVWYMRNTKELNEIYDRLNDRLTKEKAHWTALTNPNEREHEATPAGDTVNIWREYGLYRLDNTEWSNKLTFQIPSDSNFHVRDSFAWNLTLSPIGQLQSHATMGMSLLFKNDSTIGLSQELTQPGKHSLSITTDSAYQIKEIVGFLYVHRKDSVFACDSLNNSFHTPLLISDISLMRYHRKDTLDLSAKSDSISPIDTDTIEIK